MVLSFFSLLNCQCPEKLDIFFIFFPKLTVFELTFKSLWSIKISKSILKSLFFEITKELAVILKGSNHFVLKSFWELFKVLIELAVCWLKRIALSGIMSHFDDLINSILNYGLLNILQIEQEFENSLKCLLRLLSELFKLDEMKQSPLTNELLTRVHEHVELACSHCDELLEERILFSVKIICKLRRLRGARADECAI